MKKTTKRTWKQVLSLVLCTVMVLGMVFQQDFIRAKAAAGPKIAQWNLAISEGAIGLNLYFSGINDADAANMTAKVDGTSYKLGTKLSDGTYMVTHRVNVGDVSKQLSVELYKGSAKVDLTNYTAENGTVYCAVAGYLRTIKDRDDEYGELARSLNNYAECATGYTEGIELPMQTMDIDLSAYKPVVTGSMPDCITYKGSTLVLTDTFAIRHYFLFTDYVTGGEMYIDGKPATYHETDTLGLIYVEIPDIRTWDVDHMFEFRAKANGMEITFKYSVLSYAYLTLENGGDENLSKLVTSIYWYKEGYEECRKAEQTETPGTTTEDPGTTTEDPGTTTPDPGEITTEYVTYRAFGAKGDGKTDDYDAIVATHKYANENNKAVKADKGAVYYIGHMDASNPAGAEIKTPTDWTGAEFIIDDSKMKLVDGKIPDGLCYLFTIAPTKAGEKKYLNANSGDFLGIDPELSSYPEYDGTSNCSSVSKAKNFINKTFSKDTTKLSGQFHEKALYALKTNSYVRWGRNGSATATAGLRSQEEIVIVNKDGTIDNAAPLQWDWKDIHWIEKYPMDETQLVVKGGKFTTIVNQLNSGTYVHRGIAITRSNVLVQGVEHYLAGEDKLFTDKSEVDGKYYPRVGAPYQGFFRLNHCAYVTLKDCVLSNHLRVFSKGDQTNSTAPYDYYAEYCAAITLDHVVCAADADDLTGPGDPTGIMDRSRWGTTGTNYCKSITVQNGCALNRIDAHMGTYNITVKDSTMGFRGIAVVGFGDLVIENVKSYGDYFINLRRDYGSAWYGNISIKNSYWSLGTGNYSARLIFADYDPTYRYGYDAITENGVDYASMLPAKIDIDGLTIDTTEMTDTNAGIVFRGLTIYGSVLKVKDGDIVNDSYLKDRTKYPYPLKPTEEVNIKNLTILKNPSLNKTVFDQVFVQKPNDTNHNDYLFHNTKLNCDFSTFKVVNK
ncbi:MAG: hypothetical protein J5546_03890 [Lachnospiraceae bacterium]|nr:hypothetical protein [Lachnospiraceae bacterium]